MTKHLRTKVLKFQAKTLTINLALQWNQKTIFFGNHHGIEDYEFNNFTFKGDRSCKNLGTSPMTRRQRAKEMERMKETAKGQFPGGFSIDWEKMTHCPCWKQKLPKSPFNKSNDSPSKSPNKLGRFSTHPAVVNKNTDLSFNKNEESEDSEYKCNTNKKKNAIEDPSQNKRRKSKQQVKLLEAELEANPHWTNEDMEKIAKKIGLSKSQVYKWNWDQKKKLNILPSKVYVVQLPNEFIDSKSGQIVLKNTDDLKKLKALNIQPTKIELRKDTKDNKRK